MVIPGSKQSFPKVLGVPWQQLGLQGTHSLPEEKSEGSEPLQFSLSLSSFSEKILNKKLDVCADGLPSLERHMGISLTSSI